MLNVVGDLLASLPIDSLSIFIWNLLGVNAEPTPELGDIGSATGC